MDSGVNPEELGEYAEGDILFPASSLRNGLITPGLLWEDGIIPYEIKGHFSYNEKQTIFKAMEQYHSYTCIRFRRKLSNDTDYISIVSGNSGCWSSIGRIGGGQEVNLQTPYCLIKLGTVVHELLHVAGFHHEQNRWERDSYVDIKWDNIQKGKEGNFKKTSSDRVSGYGVPYDFGSVMHYSTKAFSQNGLETITPLLSTNEEIGQRKGFSKKDIEKINAMYGCTRSLENYTIVDYGNMGGTGSGGILGSFVSMLLP